MWGEGEKKRDGGEALLEMCELSTFCFKLADCASSQFVRLISLVAANKPHASRRCSERAEPRLSKNELGTGFPV